MGNGEQYRYDWYKFIEESLKNYETRLKYLKRHSPAPINWGDVVISVLYPESEEEQKFSCSEAEISKLMDLGLIEHDIAYKIWLSKQTAISWPWSWSISDLPWFKSSTPQEVVDIRIREFWFFSRQLNSMRKLGKVLRYSY